MTKDMIRTSLFSEIGSLMQNFLTSLIGTFDTKSDNNYVVIFKIMFMFRILKWQN